LLGGKAPPGFDAASGWCAPFLTCSFAARGGLYSEALLAEHADIWALGCLLCFGASGGKLPFASPVQSSALFGNEQALRDAVRLCAPGLPLVEDAAVLALLAPTRATARAAKPSRPASIAMDELATHPLFWSDDDLVTFVCHFANCECFYQSQRAMSESMFVTLCRKPVAEFDAFAADSRAMKPYSGNNVDPEPWGMLRDLRNFAAHCPSVDGMTRTARVRIMARHVLAEVHPEFLVALWNVRAQSGWSVVSCGGGCRFEFD